MTTAWVLQRIEVKDYRKALFVALLGSVFVALLARVQLPFVPVPLTGQTLGVLLVGGLLGARLGALSLLLYLLEGAPRGASSRPFSRCSRQRARSSFSACPGLASTSGRIWAGPFPSGFSPSSPARS